MNVLLTTAPHIIKTEFLDFIKGKINLLSGVLPNFGLLYLSSYLKKEGHNVHFLDGNLTDESTILSFIDEKGINVVGISSNTYEWSDVCNFIDNIKTKYPDVYVVVGGRHPTFWADNCLKDTNKLDFVVVGEGEITFSELLKKLENKEDLSSVKGIIYRDNGDIRINRKRELIPDLDALPLPDRDCIDIRRYHPSPYFYKKLPHTSMFGSRGCPYKCIFCVSTGNFRLRNPISVVDEIDVCVKKYGIKDITFYDETFGTEKNHTLTICDELVNRNLDVVWSVNAKVDLVDAELLKAMKAAGCWRILFGFESGVQKNLTTLKKGTTIEQGIEANRMAQEAGIEVAGLFMLGIPGETFEEGLETINYACKLNTDYAMFGCITPFPGSWLYSHRDKLGEMTEFKDMTLFRPAFIPNSMTRKELEKLYYLCFFKFYTRWKYIFKRLKGLSSLEDIKRNFMGFMAVFTMFLSHLIDAVRGKNRNGN